MSFLVLGSTRGQVDVRVASWNPRCKAKAVRPGLDSLDRISAACSACHFRQRLSNSSARQG